MLIGWKARLAEWRLRFRWTWTDHALIVTLQKRGYFVAPRGDVVLIERYREFPADSFAPFVSDASIIGMKKEYAAWDIADQLLEKHLIQFEKLNSAHPKFLRTRASLIVVKQFASQGEGV